MLTLWLLGLCVLLLTLGGMSLDLWRAFSERRALVNAADAAALAGASAIDEARYRATGDVLLEPDAALSRARASIAAQGDVRSLRLVDVDADTDHVEVTVRGDVGFSLLRLVEPGSFEVRVRSAAVPRRSA
jgi:Flp pilus assembly protein TadG